MMKSSAFGLLNRKKTTTVLVVIVLILQIAVLPGTSDSPTIKTDYGTALELDSFFKSVNERNDEVN